MATSAADIMEDWIENQRWRSERVSISSNTLYMDIKEARLVGVGQPEIIRQIDRWLALLGLRIVEMRDT